MAPRPLRIMVAWRSGGYGTETFAYAAWLARTTKVQICVVSALSRGWPLAPLVRLSTNDSWVSHKTESLEKTIKDGLKLVGLRKDMLDGDAMRTIESFSESTTIYNEAEEFEADVVLLGIRRSNTKDWAAKNRSRFTAESTSDALLYYSPIPLGLVTPGAKLSKHGVARVSICYIDTPQSHHALNKAVDLVYCWRILLRLVSFTPRGVTMCPTENGYSPSSDLVIKWREQAIGLLGRGIDRAYIHYPDLSIDMEVASGNGWEEAIQSIKWKKGDLLVLGSSTLGPFGRIFIGLSANHIVRHSLVPMPITPTQYGRHIRRHLEARGTDGA